VFLWRVASDTANYYNNPVLIEDTVSDDAASYGQRPPEYSFEDATNNRSVTSTTSPINWRNELVHSSGLGDFAMAGTLNTRLFFILQ
ncbi:hypothetical protein HPB47_027851, partial [Ixodes persulcatus]